MRGARWTAPRLEEDTMATNTPKCRYAPGQRVEVLATNFDKPGFPREWTPATVDSVELREDGKWDVQVTAANGTAHPQIVGKRGGNKNLREAAELPAEDAPAAEPEVTEEMARILRSASPLNGMITVYVGAEEEEMLARNLLWGTGDGDLLIDHAGIEWLKDNPEPAAEVPAEDAPLTWTREPGGIHTSSAGHLITLDYYRRDLWVAYMPAEQGSTTRERIATVAKLVEAKAAVDTAAQEAKDVHLADADTPDWSECGTKRGTRTTNPHAATCVHCLGRSAPVPTRHFDIQVTRDGGKTWRTDRDGNRSYGLTETPTATALRVAGVAGLDRDEEPGYHHRVRVWRHITDRAQPPLAEWTNLPVAESENTPGSTIESATGSGTGSATPPTAADPAGHVLHWMVETESNRGNWTTRESGLTPPMPNVEQSTLDLVAETVAGCRREQDRRVRVTVWSESTTRVGSTVVEPLPHRERFALAAGRA
ncbi:hypothetical protein JNW90_33430 [Micromonospora sp. STR1s_5]|nr:hypothetical protein [Micromonospora sp. STR1s_5]MBM0207342.1 hypothetical protein [Micromonospora sp. STR1s_5]